MFRCCSCLFLVAAWVATVGSTSAQLPAATGTQQVPSAEELYRRVLPSLVVVEAQRKDGTVIQGSGFLALRDGLAVTAWHVVKNSVRVSVRFADGETFEVSGLIDRDVLRDLAVIRVKTFGRPQLVLRSALPAVGARAYALGSPRGLDFSITEGLISQIQVVGSVRQLQFSSAVSPGSSGGPVIDSEGGVLGVTSWQLRDSQNLNFAVPTDYVLGLDTSLPTTPWNGVVDFVELTVATGGTSPPLTPIPPIQSPQATLDAARTIAVRQEHGSPELGASVEEALLKWGRFTVVAHEAQADLLMTLLPTGARNLWAGKGDKASAVLTARSSMTKVGRQLVDDLRSYVVRTAPKLPAK